MAEQYLIDTNTAIEYLNNKLPVKTAIRLEKEVLNISVITRMELLAWRNASPDQTAILEGFIATTKVHGLDEPIILKGIEVRKNYTIKLPDAIIAATALVYDYILVTRNISDFKNIPGLDLLNPWDI